MTDVLGKGDYVLQRLVSLSVFNMHQKIISVTEQSAGMYLMMGKDSLRDGPLFF